MNPAEAAVAEDAEDVAFRRLAGDVAHDFVGGGEVVRLGAGGTDVFHQLGQVESFVGGDLFELCDSGDDDALGQAEWLPLKTIEAAAKAQAAQVTDNTRPSTTNRFYRLLLKPRE